ncbi:MAG: DUF418 domain-containing protein [Brevundimonas sp.]|uniref:DUF418 domain-containing protein n=1 Tax=Brevundimonas sp. TaxID=1871086 RepID=UPI001A30B1F5|nr:DUF418 domain-containing protein [Brevundimonas sp.]MBJ7447709.1 DUF418 domain-containing protein [Brevundimonas sp.]
MTDATMTAAPSATTERIFNLDMLRGLAVLGILAVNCLAFAWPGEIISMREAMPFAVDGANETALWVERVFFEGKWRTLFSMLFGVSIFLVGGERSNAERGALLQRRLLWLLAFGVAHGVLLWSGDILLHYAYCGFIMMMFRSWSAGRLIKVGGGIILALSLLGGLTLWGWGAMPAEMAAEIRASMADTLSPAGTLAKIEQVRSGGYLLYNLVAWIQYQMSSAILIPVTVSLMMLGLGLYKSGFLSGRAPMWTYVLAIGLGAANLIGLAFLMGQNLAAPVEADPTRGLAGLFSAFAVVITLGYVAALVLLARTPVKAVLAIFAPVGRMAFTNYLMTSVIFVALAVIPGGPMLFGRAEPGTLWMWVVGVWAVLIVWSPLWLSQFRMGPFEWVWRSLTQGRRLPLRKGAAV